MEQTGIEQTICNTKSIQATEEKAEAPSRILLAGVKEILADTYRFRDYITYVTSMRNIFKDGL